MVTNSERHERIIDVLKDAKAPQSVEAVRAAAGLGSWEAAKALLLELLVEERIKGMRTSTSWIFWLDTPESGGGGGGGHGL